MEKKYYLVGTLFTIYKHFGYFIKGIFTILLQIQLKNKFLPTSKQWPAKIVAFLVFVCMAASFIARISSFENVSKRDAILALVTKQWIAKDITNYGSQSKRPKLAIHWFGKY